MAGIRPFFKKISRRKFIHQTAAVMTGSVLGLSCKSAHVAARPVVKFGVPGYSVPTYRQALDELGFTRETGIEVEIIQRPNAPNELMTQMVGAIYAGTSPYDVLDFEDEIASSFLPVGWFLPLDDLLTPDFWSDLTRPLREMTDLWNRHDGATYRVHHNFEPCYWWYRQDWFAEKKLPPPQTWQEVAQLGSVFTDRKKGVWASEEGMIKGGFLNVYISWLVRQAGGTPFQVDDKLGSALEYIYNLMHRDRVLNPACLQKNYDQQNSDYMADRVAFMRQWPFFYDVTRQNKNWYSEEKVTCTLPPAGPAGKSFCTYAAGWGYGIPKTVKDAKASGELIKFLTDKEIAAKLVRYSSWFLNARYSVLKEAGDSGPARYLKLYTDAGIITTRPHHPKFMEALAIVENAVSAFLSNQIKFGKTIQLIKDQIELL